MDSDQLALLFVGFTFAVYTFHVTVDNICAAVSWVRNHG